MAGHVPAGRALVLGGGGLSGIAWETGVLAGLAAGGADVTTADYVLGTSAGRGRPPLAAVDQVIAPWVRDRGYDWEFTITEPPFDLWSLQGEIPPPFESLAEKRWIKENKATPYVQAEKLPVSLALTPGTTGE